MGGLALVTCVPVSQMLVPCALSSPSLSGDGDMSILTPAAWPEVVDNILPGGPAALFLQDCLSSSCSFVFRW